MNFNSVIVTYNPNITLFNKVLEGILTNTKNITIIDNGSSNIDDIRNIKINFNLISLGNNIGVAAAQNIGIKSALSKGADYIWLSDQDTIYPHDYIENICLCIKELEQRGVNYSVIGPSFIDAFNNQVQPFIKYTPFSQRIIPEKGINFVSQLISSGMIIPKLVFDHVGYKREDLFIDWVDFEWCWRSTVMGYNVIGCGDTVIRHTLGDQMVVFLGKEITLRSPFRRYFFVRNAIYLSLYSNAIPIPARVQIFIQTALWMFVYVLSSKNNKFNYLQASLLGFFHGIMAKLGPKPSQTKAQYNKDPAD